MYKKLKRKARSKVKDMAAMRSRKYARKKNPEKKKVVHLDPWIVTDSTPRNGMCNQSDGRFKILPNDGKKMYNWVRKAD